MASDASSDAALQPLAPGELIHIAQGPTAVNIAPTAGGRIAQILHDGAAWLVTHNDGDEATIAWGSYPMLPWAGRLRHGRFEFDGRQYQLPLNLGAHAIHGVGFALPWHVTEQSAVHAELRLQLPEDERWPFGGSAIQRIEVGKRVLRMRLTLTAGTQAMPAVIGWHPWFRKPELVKFAPRGCYRRDDDGIAALPVTEPPPRPWDDCFINDAPVLIERGGQRLRLSSDCRHWVVYDGPPHSTCIEPQSGPPDAFNLQPPPPLAPGAALSAWFLFEWL
jgi:aldose 1-epimerase